MKLSAYEEQGPSTSFSHTDHICLTDYTYSAKSMEGKNVNMLCQQKLALTLKLVYESETANTQLNT